MMGQATTAIVGLGITEMGKVFGRNAADFAADAIALALQDAGLGKDDIRGLLINANFAPEMIPPVQHTLGFRDLSLINVMDCLRLDRRHHAAVRVVVRDRTASLTSWRSSTQTLPLRPAGSAAGYSAPCPQDVGDGRSGGRIRTRRPQHRATPSRRSGTCICMAPRASS